MVQGQRRAPRQAMKSCVRGQPPQLLRWQKRSQGKYIALFAMRTDHPAKHGNLQARDGVSNKKGRFTEAAKTNENPKVLLTRYAST